MYQAVFFDLDGTLLPLDTDAFMRSYFQALGGYFASVGCDPRTGMAGIKVGTEAMLAPDGATTNCARFWQAFSPFMADQGDDRDWEAALGAFYADVFPQLRGDVQPDPHALEVVACLRGKGYRLVLATNPLFPPEATEERLGWAGFAPEAFERITAYHNSRFAKPDAAYYQENLDALGLSPADVLMVGNDPVDDNAPATNGIDLYLVTDHLVERGGEGADLAQTPHGTMADLLAYVRALPAL